IRSMVRTGDTPQRERTSMRKRAPHIVVTTPESLFILLGSESGRRMLATTRSVIIDEIHAMVGSKRGLHLALSLERLEALAGRPLTRIGLSATQKPIEEIARFLVGMRNLRADGSANCDIIDAGHVRSRDLGIEVTAAPLEAVMSGDAWSLIYDRLAALVGEHRTTLVFVNTRRLAERVSRHLSERLGRDQVTAHHGSMSKELRLQAEGRLKRGELRALVATASLELGIDIGNVDLVCQLGSPRSIAAFLQRVGRAGHSIAGTSKGRLFPLSRDDLVECAALLDAVRRAELDAVHIPDAALDVLAQQIVAESSARECPEDELFALVRRAYPFRELPRADFDEVIRMLAEGYTTRRGHRGALIHYDAINHIVRGRRGARLTAITSAGTIPDNSDYQVILEPQSLMVGTVNEDFAVESLQGDIFQLGNTSYRILRVEQGRVRVEDAQGQPPSIPFWLGEAPGRSEELSQAVARLRTEVQQRLAVTDSRLDCDQAMQWLTAEVDINEAAASQLTAYLGAAARALGALPTQQTVIFERFFDESGGMQLVIHAPFGSRINRAWGLALRKRFCRAFNFELQAAASEDAIILSLTGAHSFELAAVARYLHSNTVRALLIQALCAAPMFTARWRWSATIALALPRFRGGRKVAAPLARMAAEDLLSSIFPDQVACAENLPGELEIPDHPLIRQTIHDCLEEAMDIQGLERVLRDIESGRIQVVARDVTEPSPLALEILTARPYAYLDDAPLEERRAQAVMSRRWLDPESAADIGRLDADAIERVRTEAWPDASTADELHDALLWLTYLTEAEVDAGSGWRALLVQLEEQHRVVRLLQPAVWIATERVPLFQALWGERLPMLHVPERYQRTWQRDAALVEIVRGRLEGLGPTTAQALATPLGLGVPEIESALAVLQAEGFAMRGSFAPAAADNSTVSEWCERRLLARIHRYTVKRLRAEIEPIAARDYLRFLFEWQRVTPQSRMSGPDAIAAVLRQLEGFEAPASAWETEILPMRLNEYDPAWLDEQCLAGRYAWSRLARRGSSAGAEDGERGAGPVKSTPIVLLDRRNARAWTALVPPAEATRLSSRARRVVEYLQTQGASFFDELAEGTSLLTSQAEDALAELVALGVVNSDSYAGLRALLMPAERRRAAAGRRGRAALFGMGAAGRWTLVRRNASADKENPRTSDDEPIELVVRTLLRRWGVVLWRVLAREASWLPPWRELLRCMRRLEARGEIRGGRFIAGFTGEQYALPEAVGLLRAARRDTDPDQYISLSGADPLNLLGILTPGARLPALSGNRVLYRDAVPVALLAGSQVQFLQ
ncbi:MAG: DEAD/DEAH box helicase, partial [Sinobacteraceae bacterium]|nr:DEAD/DEAH box helicase [Nevskiaceae bacterium]